MGDQMIPRGCINLHDGVVLHAFHRHDHLQRHGHVDGVSAARRFIELLRHIAPCALFAGLPRQMLQHSRTSASVLSVITPGMMSGRGRGRDQFGRGKGSPSPVRGGST